jgi:hypothetical protein
LKSDDGRLFVEGIISGADLDLTGERMSARFIKAWPTACRPACGAAAYFLLGMSVVRSQDSAR